MGKKNVPTFDLESALTRKESRKLKKMQAMIPYYLARCPLYNSKIGEHWEKAEYFKAEIKKLEQKAYKLWKESN